MKKKVLLSSCAAIALCLCLIAGSTFALFTDTTNFNIAITSGDIEIVATAGINSVWSANGTDGDAEDEYLVDEKDHNYVHGKLEPNNGRYFFLNGGEAVLDGANLTINRITPGDRVDVDIKIENRSDVALVYRYKIEAKDTNLAKGMVVTVDRTLDDSGKIVAETCYESMKSWTSEWYPLINNKDVGVGGDIPTKTVSFELPVYAGNEYQSEKTAQEDGRLAGIQSAEYTITVEAVQGNAVTDNESQVTIYPTDKAVQNAIRKGGKVVLDGATVNLESDFYVGTEAIVLADGVFNAANVPEIDANGEEVRWAAASTRAMDLTLEKGATLIAPQGNERQAIMLYYGTHTIRLENGSKIVASAGTTNACIQVCVATLNLYIEDVSVFQCAGAAAINLTGSSTLNITVPNAEVKAEVEALMANSSFIITDGTAVTISLSVIAQ